MEKEQVEDLKPAYDDPTPFVTPSTTPAIDFGRVECACADADTSAPPSCIVCRCTLLLSYFNCCAICGNVIESGRGRSSWSSSNRDDSSSSRSSGSGRQHDSHFCYYCDPSRPAATGLPTPATTTTATTRSEDDGLDSEEKGGLRRHLPPPPHARSRRDNHCDARYCRYTHNRWLLALFAASECVPAVGAAMLLSLGLGRHDWGLLRFGGLMAVQWWQIFVLPRLWHAQRPIIAGQLAACAFMVWYYVEGRPGWPWWEPLFVSTVLLKIVFPW